MCKYEVSPEEFHYQRELDLKYVFEKSKFNNIASL